VVYEGEGRSDVIRRGVDGSPADDASDDATAAALFLPPLSQGGVLGTAQGGRGGTRVRCVQDVIDVGGEGDRIDVWNRCVSRKRGKRFVFGKNAFGNPEEGTQAGDGEISELGGHGEVGRRAGDLILEEGSGKDDAALGYFVGRLEADAVWEIVHGADDGSETCEEDLRERPDALAVA